MSFDSYLREIMPIPVEKIEVSPNNNYLYRITAFSSVVDEFRKSIDKRLGSNKRIKTYEGWWIKQGDYLYKQALIEFRREKSVKAS